MAGQKLQSSWDCATHLADCGTQIINSGRELGTSLGTGIASFRSGDLTALYGQDVSDAQAILIGLRGTEALLTATGAGKIIGKLTPDIAPSKASPPLRSRQEGHIGPKKDEESPASGVASNEGKASPSVQSSISSNTADARNQFAALFAKAKPESEKSIEFNVKSGDSALDKITLHFKNSNQNNSTVLLDSGHISDDTLRDLVFGFAEQLGGGKLQPTRNPQVFNIKTEDGVTINVREVSSSTLADGSQPRWTVEIKGDKRLNNDIKDKASKNVEIKREVKFI